ncbi:ROK family transcriptional regulator [Kitasatospora purpeofusca]|uniref:ROK family transcriptional regulator n=1 Tax=Kitasatospora purpeofusca TaxID=67352 RepID=UPI00224CBF72|nr:ROK family transcriptional regulator [Kitasatospora purpeofusca]MCX4755393.1 ROK family transcriptional regulator [Kitasatospora purpeofusca]WSR36733.1 ROK family transcriptional regulator [Kitasatospora purpeofusca]
MRPGQRGTTGTGAGPAGRTHPGAAPTPATGAAAVMAGYPEAADKASLRRTNLGVLLRHLRDSGPQSRTHLSTATGLPKATVSVLVADLIERGLVREGELDRAGSIGRPHRMVELDGRRICGIGAEIGADHLTVLALDLCGTVVHEDRRALDVPALTARAALAEVADLVADCLSAVAGRDMHPIGITLVTQGSVDAASGSVVVATNFGWRGVRAAQELRVRLGRDAPPVLVENDAESGALAEYLAAPGRDVRELVYVTGGIGVGGASISGGKLLRGSEIGHMKLDRLDRPCPCGRTGCWEVAVGLQAFLDAAADPTDRVHDLSVDLAERLGDLLDRADAGDARTLAALAGLAGDLALGLSILVDVLNPPRIVLGGYFAVFGRYLVEPAQQILDERRIAPTTERVVVAASTLGLSNAARGGAQLALAGIFQDPSVVPVRPAPEDDDTWPR